MRKLIALIAACALFLGCVCAAAEGQTDAAQGDGPSGWRITNDINMDLDACRTLVWSIYPTDAAARKAMRSAVLLNAMEPALTITEDGIQLDVTLNGTQALSLGGQLTQDSVAIASTLLPSYVITVPTEKIMAIASSVASLFPSRKPTPKPDDDSGEALPPAGDTVPAEAQPDAGDDINPLIERISRFITEDGPEQGVFTVNGATFDLKRTYNVSPGGFVGIWDALVDWLFANEGVNTIIGIANNVGAKITAEQVKSLPPLDRLPGSPSRTIPTASQAAHWSRPRPQAATRRTSMGMAGSLSPGKRSRPGCSCHPGKWKPTLPCSRATACSLS